MWGSTSEAMGTEWKITVLSEVSTHFLAHSPFLTEDSSLGMLDSAKGYCLKFPNGVDVTGFTIMQYLH